MIALLLHATKPRVFELVADSHNIIVSLLAFVLSETAPNTQLLHAWDILCPIDGLTGLLHACNQII